MTSLVAKRPPKYPWQLRTIPLRNFCTMTLIIACGGASRPSRSPTCTIQPTQTANSVQLSTTLELYVTNSTGELTRHLLHTNLIWMLFMGRQWSVSCNTVVSTRYVLHLNFQLNTFVWTNTRGLEVQFTFISKNVLGNLKQCDWSRNVSSPRTFFYVPPLLLIERTLSPNVDRDSHHMHWLTICNCRHKFMSVCREQWSLSFRFRGRRGERSIDTTNTHETIINPADAITVDVALICLAITRSPPCGRAHQTNWSKSTTGRSEASSLLPARGCLFSRNTAFARVNELTTTSTTPTNLIDRSSAGIKPIQPPARPVARKSFRPAPDHPLPA